MESLIPGMNKALQLDRVRLTSQKQFCNKGSGASGWTRGSNAPRKQSSPLLAERDNSLLSFTSEISVYIVVAECCASSHGEDTDPLMENIFGT